MAVIRSHENSSARARPLALISARSCWIAEESFDRGGERLGVARRDQEALLAPAKDALVAVDVTGDDRRAGGHRLEEDDPEGLLAGGRRDEDLGGPEQLGLLLVGDAAEELDVDEPVGHDEAAGLPLLGSGPDDEQAALDAGLAEDPVGLEELDEPLARLVASDEQDVGDAVLPAGDRDGPPEAVDVDAVRDDLVVALEVAVDEVAGGRAHGDAAVQALGVGAHHPPAELVGRRPAPEGVERRDVHALRAAQDDRREERHERLVEVEQVEALPFQHRPDLRQVARRQGDRPDRAVGRHAEALAEADHVALTRALEAVARGDDPDVVAPRSEPLVEVADVLVHATGERVDVRSHEADLHVAAPSPSS